MLKNTDEHQLMYSFLYPTSASDCRCTNFSTAATIATVCQTGTKCIAPQELTIFRTEIQGCC